MSLMDNFRSNVKEAMQHSGISQVELADAVKVHPVTLSKILSGSVSPSVERCELIAEKVGIRPDLVFVEPVAKRS